MHLEHTDRAVTGGTHGNTASSYSLWELGKPHGRDRGLLQVLIGRKTPMSSPPVCQIVLQPAMGNASGTE